MPRTNTTTENSFTRPGQVTYTFLSRKDASSRTEIRLPIGSDWTSGLHWHETHIEYLRVIQGRITISLNGIVRDYAPESAIITVPRYARHEWHRAEQCDDVVVVEEWTCPDDGKKEAFFRNLSSVILDCTKAGPPNEIWLNWQLFVIFHHLDNFPVIWGGSHWVQWIVTHCLLLLATVLGRIIGLKGVYTEYTPLRLSHNKSE